MDQLLTIMLDLGLLSLFVVQLGCVSFLLLHTFYQTWLMWVYHRVRGPDAPPEERFVPANLPSVTIQLPVRNEGGVFERCLRSAASVAYPDDRLQIQVLDDSDDGKTTELITRVIDELRNEHPGLDFQYLHRDNRDGFKAGALLYGTKQARGQFLAIFDADFVIPEDFLERTIHYFTDENTAVVQGRWSHLNRNESLLTRMQAAKLDTHQMFEQTARYRTNLPAVFHGTAGVWRASALERAGGWNCETEVEDVELSIRSFALGGRVVYLDHLRIPSELPTSMRGFLVQQMRWKRGWTRLATSYSGTILRAPATLRDRLDLLQRIHLTWGPMLGLIMTLGVLPTFVIAGRFGLTSVMVAVYSAMLALSLVSRYVENQILVEDPEHDPADLLPAPLRYIPFSYVLGMGTSWALTQATAESFGSQQYWEVTPKSGSATFQAGSRIPLVIMGTSIVTLIAVALGILAILMGYPLMTIFYGVLAVGSAWVVHALTVNHPGSVAALRA